MIYENHAPDSEIKSTITIDKSALKNYRRYPPMNEKEVAKIKKWTAVETCKLYRLIASK